MLQQANADESSSKDTWLLVSSWDGWFKLIPVPPVLISQVKAPLHGPSAALAHIRHHHPAATSGWEVIGHPWFFGVRGRGLFKKTAGFGVFFFFSPPPLFFNFLKMNNDLSAWPHKRKRLGDSHQLLSRSSAGHRAGPSTNYTNRQWSCPLEGGQAAGFTNKAFKPQRHGEPSHSVPKLIRGDRRHRCHHCHPPAPRHCLASHLRHRLGAPVQRHPSASPGWMQHRRWREPFGGCFLIPRVPASAATAPIGHSDVCSIPEPSLQLPSQFRYLHRVLPNDFLAFPSLFRCSLALFGWLSGQLYFNYL